jgi:hypothetical protein
MKSYILWDTVRCSVGLTFQRTSQLLIAAERALLWEPKILHILVGYMFIIKIKSNLRGLSPRAMYTDRVTAACRRS